MIISDLNYMESAESNVQGGTRSGNFTEVDSVTINFTSNNAFNTLVNNPRAGGNSAAAGAKGVATNNTWLPSYSFTKADTLAVTELGGGSFSASTSVAVINIIPWH